MASHLDYGPAKALFTMITLALLAYPVARIIYNAFFHPLRKYPGPRLAAISRLPCQYWTCSGQLHTKLKQLHDQYGDVVRIEPDSLTYRNAGAWKDICGHRKSGAGSFLKDPQFYVVNPLGPNLINANEPDHSRMRRSLAHAFSEKALREQEQIVQSYIDLLISRLKGEVAASRDTVDMVKWYNYTTFDIIGDLAFGEPFDCLKNSNYHPWVAILFQFFKGTVFLRLGLVYPLIATVLKMLTPQEVLRKRIESVQLSKEKADRRLAAKTQRPDFMTYVLRHNDERALTTAEIESNANLLILAGSETTATLLSACTYYLLQNPTVLERLVREVRTSFHSVENITFLSAARLPYLHAVLEESLRMFPPVPGILPRLVPEGGATINGKSVPQGTSVSMAFLAAFHAESNFADPEEFSPERWLDGADAKYKADIKEVMQPFSFGPRNCIGRNLAYAEMRNILAKLIWNFDLSLDEESRNWPEQKTYFLWEKKPLMVKLTPVQALGEQLNLGEAHFSE